MERKDGGRGVKAFGERLNKFMHECLDDGQEAEEFAVPLSLYAAGAPVEIVEYCRALLAPEDVDFEFVDCWACDMLTCAWWIASVDHDHDAALAIAGHIAHCMALARACGALRNDGSNATAAERLDRLVRDAALLIAWDAARQGGEVHEGDGATVAAIGDGWPDFMGWMGHDPGRHAAISVDCMASMGGDARGLYDKVKREHTITRGAFAQALIEHRARVEAFQPMASAMPLAPFPQGGRQAAGEGVMRHE